MASPTMAMHDPTAIEVLVGRASQIYAPAKTNPSGTRIRRAIALQLGTSVLQELARRGDNFFYGDIEQARIGSSRVG